MKFLYIALLSFFFMGCQQKELKVPVSDQSGLHEVWNNSQVYILLKKQNNDTLADLKLGKTISTTKWLVAIDKRLKLKHLIPALQKLIKKRHKKSLHSDGKGQMFFTYLDSLQKKIAFVEFTSIEIVPENRSETYFSEHSKINSEIERWHVSFYPNTYKINDTIISKKNFSISELWQNLEQMDLQSKTKAKRLLYLNFDRQLSFDNFFKIYIYFKNHPLKNTIVSPKIFIFTPNIS